MARQDSLQGSLPLLILKVLSRRGSLHGYALSNYIEEISDSVLQVEEGSLYPALHRLEESGWVKAAWVTTDKNRRARTYEITASGRRQLNEEEDRWRAITAAVTQVLRKA
jgi:PadR family transcriptional regulator PadR